MYGDCSSLAQVGVNQSTWCGGRGDARSAAVLRGQAQCTLVYSLQIHAAPISVPVLFHLQASTILPTQAQFDVPAVCGEVTVHYVVHSWLAALLL